MSLAHNLLALLVVFIWGTNFVFIRYGLDELGPFTFAALRFALVAFPLVLFLPRPAVPWRSLISYGVLIGAGQFGFLFWAMQSDISPGLASLVVQSQVFFTVGLSAYLLSESVGRTQLIALALGLLGISVVLVFTDGYTTGFGVTLTLLAALSWAGGNLVVKHAGQVDVLAYIAWSSIFALPPLFLVAFLFEGGTNIFSAAANTSARGWAVIIWQSVGNTLIGYGLWNFLLSQYRAAIVAPWALMVPVFGLLASSVMLSEPMPAWKLVAAALILSGLTLNIVAGRERIAQSTHGV